MFKESEAQEIDWISQLVQDFQQLNPARPESDYLAGRWAARLSELGTLQDPPMPGHSLWWKIGFASRPIATGRLQPLHSLLAVTPAEERHAWIAAMADTAQSMVYEWYRHLITQQEFALALDLLQPWICHQAPPGFVLCLFEQLAAYLDTHPDKEPALTPLLPRTLQYVHKDTKLPFGLIQRLLTASPVPAPSSHSANPSLPTPVPAPPPVAAWWVLSPPSPIPSILDALVPTKKAKLSHIADLLNDVETWQSTHPVVIGYLQGLRSAVTERYEAAVTAWASALSEIRRTDPCGERQAIELRLHLYLALAAASCLDETKTQQALAYLPELTSANNDPHRTATTIEQLRAILPRWWMEHVLTILVELDPAVAVAMLDWTLQVMPDLTIPYLTSSPWLIHSANARTTLLERLSEPRLKRPERWAQARGLLTVCQEVGDLECGIHVVELLEELGSDLSLTATLLDWLSTPSAYDPYLSEEDAILMRTRAHEQAGQYPQALETLRPLFHAAMSRDLREARGLLDRMTSYNQPTECLENEQARWNTAAHSLDEGQAPSQAEIDRAVPLRVMVIGGNQTQAQYDEAIRTSLLKEYPTLTLSFHHTEYQPTKRRDYQVLERDVRTADAVVLHQLMRTTLFRRLRHAATIWEGCTGRGRQSIETSVRAAIERALACR